MIDRDEVRFVYRKETFNDLAVRELAQARAKCICRIQNKRCKKSMCKSCPQFTRYYNCKSMLSEYDQQRLDSYTADYYGEFSGSPSHFMTHKEYKRYYRNIVLIIVACLAAFCLVFGIGGPFDSPYPEVEYQSEISDVYLDTIEEIIDNVLSSRLYGLDLTGDGNFNCQDKSILFKLFWDEYACEVYLAEYITDDDLSINRAVRYARSLCNSCDLVRNYNPVTGMNHLFVRIYEPTIHKYIMLEPDISDRDVDLVNKIFGKEYDSKANYYGETEKFMYRIDPGLRRMFRSVK